MADDDLLISISTDLTNVKRQLRELGQSVTQATNGYTKSFEAAGRSIDKAISTSGVQRRINDLTGVFQKSSKEWQGALADQQKEMDALRAKYSPLFAAQQQYLANLKDIKTAQALGAISASEAAAAISRQKAAFATNVIAINNTKKAVDDTTRSLKLNRIGMMELQAAGINTFQALAAGISLDRVVMMEGAQVVGALIQGTEGVGAKIVSLAAKFPLATAAIAAAGVAVAAYAVAGGNNIKTLDEIVKSHDATVKLLGAAWDEATAKKKNYAAISANSANILGEKDVQDAKNLLTAQIKGIFDAVYKTVGAGGGNQGPLQTVLKSQFEPFKQALSDLANTHDVSAFISNIDSIAEINPKLSSARDALRDLAMEAAKTAAEIPALGQPVDEIADVIDKFNRQMADVTSKPLQDALQGIFDKAKDGKLSIDQINDAVAALEQANPSFSGIIDAIGQIITQARGASAAVSDIYARTGGANGSPNGRHTNPIAIATEKAIQDANYRGVDVVPTPAPNREDLGAAYDKALKKGSHHRIPARTADDRFAEDIKSIQARTQALAVERGLLGATYEEQQKRLTAFDLEQQALKQVREEARRKGDQDWQNAQLSEDQKKKIDEVSDAYARQADALKKAQEEMQFEQDIMKGVLDDIHSALEDGKITAKEWGDIFLNVLDKIINKLENDFIDALFAANNAAGGGGSLLGGLWKGIGTFFGGGGGGGSTDPWLGLRANGGPVTAGKPYIVGEKRPELFVPNQSGTIIPQVPTLRPGSGGLSVSVVLSPTIDNRGASAEAVAKTQEALAQLKSELPGRVVDAVRQANKQNVSLGFRK